MNLSAIGALATSIEGGIWHRVVPPMYVKTVLSAAYTAVVPSRFNDGSGPPAVGMQMLYFSDSPVTALYEAGAILGPYLPFGPIANPRVSSHMQSFNFALSHVVTLDDTSALSMLDISAQELSGDWKAYGLRGPAFPVQAPVGLAPTQILGRALYMHPTKVEAFTFPSAKLGTHRNIAVFPQNMRLGSSISFQFDDGSGVRPYSLNGSLP